MIRYIIFAPLLGAVINWLAGRRFRNEKFIGFVGCGAVGISTLIAFYLAFKKGGALDLNAASSAPVLDHLWTWIRVGSFRADFGFGMDRLSGIYACFITFVGLLIHIFSVGYMRGDSGFYRFFAYMNLFMFMMLTLVLADNFLLMFVGWEGVGLCSYLLIGYYFEKTEAADAAKKAFVANRIGDWGVVLGIMAVFYLTTHAGNPSISFFTKPAQHVISALSTIAGMPVDPFTVKAITAGGITSAAVLLFIGATGKSAQIPLFVWLPDAMAGPTPVSALIHAATMVTAGVYMIVRCSAIYSRAPSAMFIVAVIGTLTAVMAATIGLAQNDIKKVLAYSTISQLGYMMLACGVGAFVAAIFHVMTHAFFKALLFLGSGSVIDAMHHEQDMRRMGGLKKLMPITFATMATGWLAICGIPIFAGFFSKDEILWKTWSTGAIAIPAPWGKILWAVGAATALLTAVYMTRLMVMTFWGKERFHDPSAGNAQAHSSHHEVHMPHESPWVMTVPLIVLAVLSTLGGLIGVPYALSNGHLKNYFQAELEPVVTKAPEIAEEHASSGGAERNVGSLPAETPGRSGAAPLAVGEGSESQPEAERVPTTGEVHTEWLFTGISVLIGLGGIVAGFLVYSSRPLLQAPGILQNKYYVDEVYDAALINPIKEGSRAGLWQIFDLGVIDGIVNGLGRALVQIGAIARYLQPGFIRSYAAIILLGALAVIGYFAYFAALAFGR